MRRRRLPALVLLLALLAATALTAVPASAGGGCHRPATDARGTTLALTDLCFSPTVLRVDPGSEVTIVNRDPVLHPLSRPGREWYWDGGVGDTTTVRLDAAGTYPFFCYAHPGMVGVVVVGDGGTGSGAVEVAATGGATAAGAELAADKAAPAGAATAGAGTGQFPVAWLVVVALAALVGAVAGTRLAVRFRAGEPRSG
jgi:plastocyanin